MKSLFAPLTSEEDTRGCVAEISLDAIVHNFNVTVEKSGGHPAMCTVKANAYGHGAAKVAPVLSRAGAHGFGVVTLDEAAELREVGIAGPILLVGGASWFTAPERVFALGALPVVASREEIDALDRVGRERGECIDVHVGIDTGLAREGFYVGAGDSLDVSAITHALKSAKFVRATGAMTHFRNADLEDETQSLGQIRFFSRAVGALCAQQIPLEVVHFSNSAASLRALSLTEDAPKNVQLWSRPGISLYGITPFPDGRMADELMPAMAWRAPVVIRKKVPAGTKVSYGGTFVTTRETELAVLGVGYADGLPRHLSNRGKIVFGDTIAPILGRVCMDLTVVDVTDVVANEGAAACGLGTKGWLLGGPSSNAQTAWDVGRAAETIGYEIVVRVSRRVPRLYR